MSASYNALKIKLDKAQGEIDELRGRVQDLEDERDEYKNQLEELRKGRGVQLTLDMDLMK